MDAKKLQQANELSDLIGRLECAQREQAEVPGLGRAVPNWSVLSGDALLKIRTIIDTDLQAQLDEARKRFAAL